MSLVYFKHDPEHLYFSDEEYAMSSVLLYDPALERYSTSIGDRFRQLDASLRNVDLVVFRVANKNDLGAIVNDPIIKNVLGSTAALGLAGDQYILDGSSLLELPGLASISDRPSIEVLRTLEIEAILDRTNAIHDHDKFHYILPSGVHADRFIRLGDALRDLVEISRLTDWIMPFLDGASAVFADSGSITPLLLEIRHRRRMLYGDDLIIDCLDKYPDNRSELSRRFNGLLALGLTTKQIVMIISVMSSGRLWKLTTSLSEEHVRSLIILDTRPQSVVRSENEPSPIITIPVHRWRVSGDGTCEACSTRQNLLISTDSYEVIAEHKWERKSLSYEHAEKHKWFWEQASSANAVQLHVSRPYPTGSNNSRRHFAVFIDTARLLELDSFRERCRERLKTLPDPGLTLIPDHAQTEQLEYLAKSVFPNTYVVRVRPGPLHSDLEKMIGKVNRILIVDDAIVTGTTLHGIRTDVFSAAQRAGKLPELYAFVCYIRPGHPETLRALKNCFHHDKGSRLECVETLLLPTSDSCPWCDERRLLIESLSSLTKQSQVCAQTRIRRLDGQLVPPMLLGAIQPQAEALRSLGSYLGELDQITAFAACTSAVQEVRAGLIRTGGIVQVIDLPMILGAYYEAVFPAAVLRTCMPRDVYMPGWEELITSVPLASTRGSMYPGLIAELGLAAAMGKLPAMYADTLLRHSTTDDKDTITLMRELITINTGKSFL